MAYIRPCKIIRLHALSSIDLVSTPRAAQHFLFLVLFFSLFVPTRMRTQSELTVTVGTSPCVVGVILSAQLATQLVSSVVFSFRLS